mmetsp:Transcript_7076/g.13886  ORF Transcript_7076/g.13886 Transcript_7076/m.13886 type:complete len:415 (+) Transcript_7076:442-1686(+)
MMPAFWSTDPSIRASRIIFVAIFSAFRGSTPRRAPKDSRRMFLYTREAASTLCCNTALSRYVTPSLSVATWCSFRVEEKACRSAGVTILWRYIFFTISNAGTERIRSSFMRELRRRDLCGPAGASTQHVAASQRSWKRSWVSISMPKGFKDSSKYLFAAKRNCRLLSRMRAYVTLYLSSITLFSTSWTIIPALLQYASAETESSSSKKHSAIVISLSHLSSTVFALSMLIAERHFAASMNLPSSLRISEYFSLNIMSSSSYDATRLLSLVIANSATAFKASAGSWSSLEAISWITCRAKRVYFESSDSMRSTSVWRLWTSFASMYLRGRATISLILWFWSPRALMASRACCTDIFSSLLSFLLLGDPARPQKWKHRQDLRTSAWRLDSAALVKMQLCLFACSRSQSFGKQILAR